MPRAKRMVKQSVYTTFASFSTRKAFPYIPIHMYFTRKKYPSIFPSIRIHEFQIKFAFSNNYSRIFSNRLFSNNYFFPLRETARLNEFRLHFLIPYQLSYSPILYFIFKNLSTCLSRFIRIKLTSEEESLKRIFDPGPYSSFVHRFDHFLFNSSSTNFPHKSID